MRILLGSIALLVGCSGDKTTPATGTSGDTSTPLTQTTDTQTTGGGACGDVSYWNVSLAGTVRGPDHQPAVGATVALEERVFNAPPKTYGSVTTDADGNFQIDAVNLVSVEGCWGIVLDYHLLGSMGTATADDSMNQSLYGAIEDGTLFAQLAVPIQLELPDSGT